VIRFLKQEYRKAKKEVSRLEGAAKLQYVWDYYKLWIIGVVCAVFLIIYFVTVRIMTPNDNWFYITIANTQADAGNGSQIWKDFVEYSGYDTKEKNVYFNTNCYFDPFSERPNNYYTYFVAYVDAGTLDLIAMDKEDLQKLGERGRLLDLTAPEAAQIMEKYKDRLIYALPLDREYSTEPVPIGIDLSDSRLITDYHIYSGSCAVGLSANCPHMEAVMKFLSFALEGGE
jgi:hypothetical protein